MKTENFSNSEHLPTLLSWLVKREAYIVTPEEIPENGFIVFDNDIAIAAGFLRLVEGGYAQIDGLTTNPDANSKQRSVAIDLVINAAIKRAKDLKIKQLMAFTELKNLSQRTQDFGFIKPNHHILILKLT